jgi:hypothetical protein
MIQEQFRNDSETIQDRRLIRNRLHNKLGCTCILDRFQLQCPNWIPHSNEGAEP